MPRRLYALHRWISALAMLQLAAWTTSGLYFALASTDLVHGRGHGAEVESPLPGALGVVTPATALACLSGVGLMEVTRLDLRATPAGVFYVARGGHRVVRLDARTCALAPVTPEEAERIARRDQPGEPEVVAMEAVLAPTVEYRGKPVPAWRVVLADDEATAVYVDAITGDVTARRTDTWRTYDFLWSLHIMDYGARDDFHHPWLIAAALVTAATVLSGALLWGLRAATWARRRRRAGDAPA